MHVCAWEDVNTDINSQDTSLAELDVIYSTRAKWRTQC